jgi:hypothetical protein
LIILMFICLHRRRRLWLWKGRQLLRLCGIDSFTCSPPYSWVDRSGLHVMLGLVQQVQPGGGEIMPPCSCAMTSFVVLPGWVFLRH